MTGYRDESFSTSQTPSQVTESRSTQLRHHSTKQPKRFNVTKADLLFIGFCVVVAVYLLLKDPLLVSVLGCASVVFIGLWHLIHAVPILEKYLGAKIRFWHTASLIITVTALLNTLIAPAHAIFLSGLEQFFVNLAQQTSQAGGATNTLDPNVIGLIFNLIRGVFLLLVAAIAILYATTQGMAVQIAGFRQQVDPHWRRGISYLKIGLRWLQGVFHKGRELLTPVPLLPQDL